MKTLKTTWTHIRRSPYQALAAILMMFLTFLTISVFIFVTLGSSMIISYFESTPRVSGFFRNDTKQEDIDALIARLRSTESVSRVKFVTKSEAFERYKEWNKDNPILLDFVSSDILPPSVEVSTENIEDLPDIAQILKSDPNIGDVVFLQDVVKKLIQWTSAIRQIGIALIVILSMVSIFIMATIIGFRISQKREEIEIMRLLSATNWYIRWPFLFEGMFYGMVGAFFGWLISSAVLFYATPYLKSFMGEIPIFPIPPLFYVELLVAEMVVAIMLGMISSFLAVLRYLK